MAEETWGNILTPNHAFWAALGALVVLYGPRAMRDAVKSAGEQITYGQQVAADRVAAQRLIEQYRKAGEFAGPGAEGLYSLMGKISQQLEALTQYMQPKEA